MRHAALRRSIALTTMILWAATSACHTWAPLETSPPVAEQVEAGDQLRVFTTNGGQTRLFHGFELKPDTLVGFTARGHADAPSRRIAIAVDDIERIEARKAKTGATVALVLGSGLLIAAIIGGAQFASSFD